MDKKNKVTKINESTSRPSQQIPASSASNGTGHFLRKSAILILFFLVFALGITLRVYNLFTVGVKTPDEDIYTGQSAIIAQNGREGLKLLLDKHNSDREYWKLPPPTRIGYLYPLSLVMKITNRKDIKIGAYFSCFFSIVTLALLAVFGLRFFNRWITLYALLFMSVCPADLAIARRAWQDAMFGCVGLFLVYFWCETMRASNKTIWYILFIATGSYCMLIKESGAVIYGLCIAWLFLVLLIREKSFLKSIIFIGFSALGAGISIAILSYAAGGILTVISVLMHIKEAVPENTYAITYQSGPWYYLFGAFWSLSPTSAFLCLVGIAGTFLFDGTPQKTATLSVDGDRIQFFGVIFFMISLVTITALIPHLQNLRYVSVLFAPFYLMGGMGLWYVVSRIRTKLNKHLFYILIVCVFIAINVGAVTDYRKFVEVFVKKEIKDLTIWNIRRYLR